VPNPLAPTDGPAAEKATPYALTPTSFRVGSRMATLTDTQLDQALTVEAWRTEVLTNAGYPADAAHTIGLCLDVDLHHAVHLLEHGCPPATALRILL
jgi:hypothetical protein